MVKEVLESKEFNELIASKNLTVVDFFATWCGPCKQIAPFINKVNEDKDYCNVTFLKVDVDKAEDITQEYSVSSMPTFIFLKDGKEVHRFSGASKDKLLATVEKFK